MRKFFMQRLTIKIHGFVQGVNFRWYAQKEAQKLGLVGYVKNLLDDTVEVVAEGEEEVLKKLLEWCKVGPQGARVERVEERWENVANLEYSGFGIKF